MFKAKNLFDQELIVVYSDIYVEKEIFKDLALNKKDLVLTADKSWQEYYMDRSLHPEEQAEKIIIDKNSKVLEIGKDLIINKSNKYYEFIGLFKASKKAAIAMKNTFLMIDNKINSKDKFERSSSWSNAYLTDFFQFIINNNILDINVNIVSKGWAEFDTIEDYNRLNNIIKSQKLISIKIMNTLNFKLPEIIFTDNFSHAISNKVKKVTVLFLQASIGQKILTIKV